MKPPFLNSSGSWVDRQHLMRFQSETSVFKFLLCCVDGKQLIRVFRVTLPSSNSSGVVWTESGALLLSTVRVFSQPKVTSNGKPYRPSSAKLFVTIFSLAPNGHLRTLEKCRKHSPAARVFYIHFPRVLK